jgi:hypothetical protein
MHGQFPFFGHVKHYGWATPARAHKLGSGPNATSFISALLGRGDGGVVMWGVPLRLRGRVCRVSLQALFAGFFRLSFLFDFALLRTLKPARMHVSFSLQ